MVKDVNSYDYNGTLLSRSEFRYDARSRLTKVTQQIDDVNFAETFYDYSDTGLGPDNEYHIRITDAESKCTYIRLDESGRRVKTLYPSSDYEELVYNADNTLATKAVWDANDVKHWIEYYYDGYSRLTDVNYPDSGSVHHTYDGFGRKTLTTDIRNAYDNIGGSGQIAYGYNVLGRIDSVTEQDDYQITYTYKADGQKQSIKVYNDTPGLVYDVQYDYDTALRLDTVSEPLLVNNDLIAEFNYDKNGNRKKLKYYLDGYETGDIASIDYTYNLDNLLTGFATTGGPTFTLSDVNVDGLGRLKNATETISYPGPSNRTHNLAYIYDMRSQLTDANISGINGYTWVYNYQYRLDGNIERKTVNSSDTDYEYDTTSGGSVFDSDIMTRAGGAALTWDENGRLTVTPTILFKYNWDGKLRSAMISGDSISIKYDPMGNRVYKSSSAQGTSKYIIDISSELPTILIAINGTNGDIMKTYIYADSQILCQHDVPDNNKRYFYLHDRLGSVREIIDTDGDIVNSYTYNPFGEMFPSECNESVSNPFKFTGQWFDSEIEQYYLRARMYDPMLMRFTARDPVYGGFKEPMTLHKYLYCLNDPVNRTDLSGKLSFTESVVVHGIMGGLFRGLMDVIRADIYEKSWKDILASGGIGFLKGFAFGSLSGGIASFSAQGFLWLGMKDSFRLYMASGAIGGGSSGAIEGAFEVFFSDASYARIQERAVAGLIGGILGGQVSYGLSDALPGLIGGLGVDQFMQEFYEFCIWFRDLHERKDD